MSSDEKRVVREEAYNILRALDEGGQESAQQHRRAGVIDQLQAGDGGTYTVIGKDVATRKYTVLLKDTNGLELGVASWPFDLKARVQEPLLIDGAEFDMGVYVLAVQEGGGRRRW